LKKLNGDPKGSEKKRVWFDPDGLSKVTRQCSGAPEKTFLFLFERAQNVKLPCEGVRPRASRAVGSSGAIRPGSPPFNWARRVEDTTLLAGYG